MNIRANQTVTITVLYPADGWVEKETTDTLEVNYRELTDLFTKWHRTGGKVVSCYARTNRETVDLMAKVPESLRYSN